MNKRKLLLLTTAAYLSVGIALGATAGAGVANVRDFGAKGDGQTDDT